MFILASTGCNTLSSLGLPFGGTGNEIIQPAKSISEAPGDVLAMPRELATAPLPVYIIEIGDTILIEPVKFDSTIRLPGDQIVKPDGFVSLGEFGRIYAHGKTIEQVEGEAQAQINDHLRFDLERAHQNERAERLRVERESAGELDSTDEGDLPLKSEADAEELVLLQRRIDASLLANEISARLVNWDSKKIYVLGEVNSPGSFAFTGNQTALDGIIEAGGMTSQANRHQIVVARPTTCDSCRVVMKICYDQIVQLGDSSTNYQLQPGDRVFVPALTFCEDVKQSLRGGRYEHCPRCANCPTGCDLPTGCETGVGCVAR